MSVRCVAHADVPELREAILASDLVAVDTEFHAENRYLPELFLLQVATADGRSWIVDPLVPGLVAAIAEALRSVPWVVHGGEHDLRILEVALGGVPAAVRDSQVEAGLLEPAYPSAFAALNRRWCGVELAKGETLSDWSRRPLSPSQLSYAAQDVACLLPLARTLATRLAERGRLELAAAACAEARRQALHPEDRELFAELGAAGVMEGRQLAILQDLVAWREERSRAANQAPRAFLSDGALVDLARRQPGTGEGVAAGRRVPKALARHADDLAEVVRRASDRPPATWPRAVRRDSPEARRSAFLQLWAASVGAAQGWAQGLVLPRRLADRLALEPALDHQELANHLGWRDPLVGRPLLEVAAGRVALRLEDAEVRAAEDRADDVRSPSERRDKAQYLLP